MAEKIYRALWHMAANDLHRAYRAGDVVDDIDDELLAEYLEIGAVTDGKLYRAIQAIAETKQHRAYLPGAVIEDMSAAQIKKYLKAEMIAEKVLPQEEGDADGE